LKTKKGGVAELDEVPKWESRKRELKEHLESLEQELERAKKTLRFDCSIEAKL